MLHGARPVTALLEMHGEFGRDFAAAITVNRQSPFGDALVDLRTAHRRYQPVSDIQIENVTKTMAGSHRSVGQFSQPCRGYELMPCQLFTLLFHPFERHIESRCNRYRRTLHAGNARSLQSGALVRAEPLDMFFDQLANVRRNSLLRFSQVHPQLPDPLLLDNYPL